MKKQTKMLETETANMQRAVTNGIAWLDQAHPGWRDRLDLDTLDMGSTRTCVVAQLFGDPEEIDMYGRSFSRAKLNQKKCEKRGFDLTDGMDTAGLTHNDLTAAWKEALNNE